MGLDYFAEAHDRPTRLGNLLIDVMKRMVARYEVYTELIELEFQPPPLRRHLRQEPPHGR